MLSLEKYDIISYFYELKNCRATVDVNREINEAAQTCSNAEQAYNLYHNKIQSIINGFTQGKGLLFDIHGQVCNNIFLAGFIYFSLTVMN